jgi:hypothetical protein
MTEEAIAQAEKEMEASGIGLNVRRLKELMD